MRRLGLLTALFLAGCSVLVPERIVLVEPTQAAALLRAHRDAVVLDVSPPAEFDEAHLPRAVNIPRSQLWSRMDELPDSADRVILVCDARGERSFDAALALRDEGYRRVYELAGGVSAWRRTGLPLAPASVVRLFSAAR